MRLAVFLFFTLLLASPAVAYHTGTGFGCSVRSSCTADEVCLLSMSDTGNAHASDCSAYDNKVCCNKFQSASVKSSCDSGEYGIMSISSTTGDAHIAEYYDPFAQQVCAGYTGVVACQYATIQPNNYDCVLGMSSQTNAHVGTCEDISGGAIWCNIRSTFQAHTLLAKLSGTLTDKVYIANVGDSDASQLSTQTYAASTRYLLGYRGNTIDGVVLADGSLQRAFTEKSASDYRIGLEPSGQGGKLYLVFAKGDVEKVRQSAAAASTTDSQQLFFGIGEVPSANTVNIGVQPSKYVDIQGSDVILPGIYEIVIRDVDTTADAEIIEVRKK